jgi:1-deoxy-D-xylulose-5-phosphate reductoisomerase
MRGTAGAVLNAANEVAAGAFLAGKMPFGMISRTVELTIARHRLQERPALADLLDADQWARATAEALINEPSRG